MDIAKPRRTDVLLLDNHRAFRELMAAHLAGLPDFDQVVETGSPDEAITAARDFAARSGQNRLIVLHNVVLCETDARDFVPALAKRLPGASFVALTGVSDPARLGRAIEAGTIAVISKSQSLAEIVTACRQAAAGRLQIDSGLALEYLRAASRERHERESASSAFAALSARERQILKLIAAGRPDREIATDLHISYETVRTHVGNIMRKLQVNSRTAAILFAIRHDSQPG